MSFFLILLPFLVFGLTSWLTSVTLSLFATAAVALALIIHERLKGESAKVLNITAAVMFGGLGLILLLTHAEYDVSSVRVITNAGFLIMALASLALRAPFTLQYARERESSEVVTSANFVRVNTILTWAWAGAFTLMLAVDIVSVWWPSALWIGVGMTFATRNAAVQFTKWYAQLARARAARTAASNV